MTKEQASDLLDNLIGFIEDSHGSDYDEALKLAIKALEQEPCEDAISRHAVKDWFCTNYCSEHNKCEHFEKGDCNSMNELYSLPFVTPQPKTGRWIKNEGSLYCSFCGCGALYDKVYPGESVFGKTIRVDSTFCPTCGAKMNAESEDGNGSI